MASGYLRSCRRSWPRFTRAPTSCGSMASTARKRGLGLFVVRPARARPGPGRIAAAATPGKPRRRRARASSRASSSLGTLRSAMARLARARAEIGRELERLAERRGRVVVAELLEQGHADVVGAVGRFERLGRGRRRRAPAKRGAAASATSETARRISGWRGASAAAAVSGTRPSPSRMVRRSSARASTVSTAPLGQRTSTFTAPVAAPEAEGDGQLALRAVARSALHRPPLARRRRRQ